MKMNYALFGEDSFHPLKGKDRLEEIPENNEKAVYTYCTPFRVQDKEFLRYNPGLEIFKADLILHEQRVLGNKSVYPNILIESTRPFLYEATFSDGSKGFYLIFSSDSVSATKILVEETRCVEIKLIKETTIISGKYRFV